MSGRTDLQQPAPGTTPSASHSNHCAVINPVIQQLNLDRRATSFLGNRGIRCRWMGRESSDFSPTPRVLDLNGQVFWSPLLSRRHIGVVQATTGDGSANRRPPGGLLYRRHPVVNLTAEGPIQRFHRRQLAELCSPAPRQRQAWPQGRALLEEERGLLARHRPCDDL